MAGGSNARTARGQGRIPVDRVPYVVDVAVKALAGHEAPDPGRREEAGHVLRLSRQAADVVPPDAELHVLARPEQDIVDALGRLAEAVGAPKVAKPDNGPRPEAGRGALTPESVASTVGALMPEGAVIADEVGNVRPRLLSADQGGAAA